MRSAEMKDGRVFVLRLEEGESLHGTIESFCAAEGIRYATVTAVGGAGPGSRYVCGPEMPLGDTIDPITRTSDGYCELTGTGNVFPDEDGNPILHMHGSLGRDGSSSTGCFRAGIVAWLVMEVVIRELVGEGPVRKNSDPRIDSKLLEIEHGNRGDPPQDAEER
jgi:predicted DNA-binding protein with PD1-like motif